MKRVTPSLLIGEILEDRARFDSIVEAIPRPGLEAPLLAGGWSVKDTLAHIAWGDRENARVALARDLSAGSDLWDVSEDERNAKVVEASRDVDLDDVLAEYRDAFESYLHAIRSLSARELNEPFTLQGLTERAPGWRPWRLLYDPDHCALHGRVINESMTQLGASTQV